MLMSLSNLKVYVSTKATDMRKSFDSLANEVLITHNSDPSNGSLYVFFNKNLSSVKMLLWEEGGYWIYYRRLEKGKFVKPISSENRESIKISSQDLSLLLDGIELKEVQQKERYKRYS